MLDIGLRGSGIRGLGFWSVAVAGALAGCIPEDAPSQPATEVAEADPTANADADATPAAPEADAESAPPGTATSTTGDTLSLPDDTSPSPDTKPPLDTAPSTDSTITDSGPLHPADGTVTTGGTCPTGDGVNDACACDDDAHSYCAGLYGEDWKTWAAANGYTTASWKYSLLDCLAKQPVSEACTASLARRAALNEAMMDACQTFCSGLPPQPGAEPCVDHLKAIYDTITDACRDALDAHEAAKKVTNAP